MASRASQFLNLLFKPIPANEYLTSSSSATHENGDFNLDITVGFDCTLEFHDIGKLGKSEKLMLNEEKETYGVNRNFDIEIPEMMLAEISPGTVRAGAVNGSIDEYTELFYLGKKFSREIELFYEISTSILAQTTSALGSPLS